MKLIKILFISITIMLLSVGCLYAADNNTTYENNTQTTMQDMGDLNVVDNEILSENTTLTTNCLNTKEDMAISKNINQTTNNPYESDNMSIFENSNQTINYNFYLVENTSIYCLYVVENITDHEILKNIATTYLEYNNYTFFGSDGGNGLILISAPPQYPIIVNNNRFAFYSVEDFEVFDYPDRMEIRYSDNCKVVITSPNKKIFMYKDKEIIKYSDNIKIIEYHNSNGTSELILYNKSYKISFMFKVISPVIRICGNNITFENTTTTNNTNDTYKTVTNTDLKKSAPVKTVVKAPKVTSKFKKSKFFQIKITDKKSKKPVSCKIKVKVYTGKKFKTYTLKTNKKGIAKFNVKTLKKGSHKVVIKQNNSKYIVNSQSKIIIK